MSTGSAAYDHVTPLEGYRLRSGLSQAEAGERSGVDQRTIRYLEHGEREPRMPVVRRLAALYGVDPADLLEEIRSYSRRAA